MNRVAQFETQSLPDAWPKPAKTGAGDVDRRYNEKGGRHEPERIAEIQGSCR